MKNLRVAAALKVMAACGLALAACGGSDGASPGGGGASSGGSGPGSGGSAGSEPGKGATCASTCQKSIALACPAGLHDQAACEASCKQQQTACASMATTFQTYLDCIQSKPIECGSFSDAPSSPDCLAQGLAIFSCALTGDGGAGGEGGSAGLSLAVPVIIATEAENIGAIAVYDSTLYWTINNDSSTLGAIKALNLPSGAPTTLATGQQNVNTLAVDSSGVYWTTANVAVTPPVSKLMHLALGETTPDTLSSDLNFVFRIAIDDQTVYVADTYLTTAGTGGGVLLSMPKAGGPLSEMFRHTDYLWRIAVDDSDAWVAAQNGVPGLFRVPLAGGPAVRVTDDIQHPFAGSVALDATNAYWADTSGSVLTMPKAGGEITTLATVNSAYDRPSEVALDDTGVYFSTEFGGIRRVAKTGGEAEVLKSSGTGADYIEGMVLTEAGIYFYVPLDRAIEFIPK
ncbi:MAG: hypothetical protein WDO74_26280 [Pseudomonadota bacterium]